MEKSRFKDSRGRTITQSLFIETNYDPEVAIYSLREYDYEWNGKVFPSLRLLYIKEEDPTEYIFANKYLYNWPHWQRILENKMLRIHIDEWRSELEYKLKSKATMEMIKAAENGNYQAAKWLVDKGWATRPAGRPSKAEIQSEKEFQARILDEYSADADRLKLVKA
jgi:hypothetical protein